jgi:MFS transporter, CP family, cyanate transporter
MRGAASRPSRVAPQVRTAAKTAEPRGLHPLLVGLVLVLVAVNLRTTVASLPPLLYEIERELGLSGAAAGMLTALPVLCMAVFAPMAHRLAHRFGREATALGAVTLVAAGNGLRFAGGTGAVLFGGTFVAGVGVAICGVVLPGIVKELFSRRAGTATGAYSVAMMLGAAAAATLAVPLERWLGSWQASLAAWAVPALFAALVWLPVTVRANQREPAEVPGGRLPWRSGTAWLVAAFFSLQAALAYAFLAWLAPAYQARGWSPAAAGALLGVNGLAQLAAALVLPALSDRSIDRRPALVGAVSCTVVGAGWLVAFPAVLPWVASTVLGLGLGGGFSLLLVVLVDYAADAGASSGLAAMVFFVGYLAAAAAPVTVGAMRDATGGFTAPFLLLTCLALAELVMATRLGPRHRSTVG